MIVGLIPTYLEGRTVQHAIRTALTCCDRVIVCEGPAGPVLPDASKVPPTDCGDWMLNDGFRYFPGRWKTDATKRNAMLEVTRNFEPPVWGLWLDGDEVLINGEYLRDWIDYITWQDRLELQAWLDDGGDLSNETKPAPTSRIPLRLIELDGSISMCYVKLVRVDLIREYTLSLANLINVHGVEERAGNLHEHITGWMQAHPRAAEGYLYTPPGPAPCDPYIVHRSMLRHPLRAGLRLHDQERDELERLESLRIGTPPTST